MKPESIPMELLDQPMTEDAGVEALLGVINPKAGQIDNEAESLSVAEEEPEVEAPDDDETTVEAEAEADQGEAEESEPSDSDTIELADEDYDYLVSVRDHLADNGIESIDQVKSGLLMQADYTRKTQALSSERKEFEGARDTQLQQTAELLEIAQAMVYGQQPKHSSQDLQKLKESDPRAYEEALESRVIYDQRKAEIDGIAKKVTEQHQQAAQAKQQEYVQEQAQLLTQLIPEFADEAKATEKVNAMTEYFESIGGSAEQLSQVTDAIALKVLHDATFGAKATSEAGKAKQSQKKVSRRVIRKGGAKSKADKQAAKQQEKLAAARAPDGSLTRDGAVELILESFNQR